MNNDIDRFEDYLRTFSGPELDVDRFLRAATRSHRHRLACVGGVCGALAAACVVVLFSVFVYSTPPATITPAKTEVVAPSPENYAVDRESLERAYRRGDMDELEAQLSRASKRFTPVKETVSAQIL